MFVGKDKSFRQFRFISSLIYLSVCKQGRYLFFRKFLNFYELLQFLKPKGILIVINIFIIFCFFLKTDLGNFESYGLLSKNQIFVTNLQASLSDIQKYASSPHPPLFFAKKTLSFEGNRLRKDHKTHTADNLCDILVFENKGNVYQIFVLILL